MNNNKLSLYIHIPWCIKKCPYCDFNSYGFNINHRLPEKDYIDSLISDLKQALPLINNKIINTVFIGGGTPSLFNFNYIKLLIDKINDLMPINNNTEITIEINPGAINILHFEQYINTGINRLSIGVQSFNQKHLNSLGRIHDSNTAINTILHAKKYFNNINIDLIYGIQEQTTKEVIKDLNVALNLDLKHISYYNLIIEPNTYFAKHMPINLPSNDLCYEMEQEIKLIMQHAKYDHYEISNYAKKHFQCKHNLNYWTYGDYLGIGAGAHSKLTINNKIIRQVREKNPKNYMQNIHNNQHIVENIIIDNDNTIIEFAINAFRLINGFNLDLFTQRTNLNVNKINNKLNIAINKNFIIIKNNKVILTKHGQRFLNDLLLLFLD